MRQLLKSIWLFFPGILFLLLSIFCLWTLGQGKDLLVAFIDKKPPTASVHFYYNRIVFFLIIGFWVYVSWYSSRIIAYIKKRQQKDLVMRLKNIDDDAAEETYITNTPPYEISKPFLDEFPRIIGNACFLVLELAVLQLPILNHVLPFLWAWILFVLFLVILRFINKWIDKKMTIAKDAGTKEIQLEYSAFYKKFLIILWALIGYVAVLSFIREVNIYSLLFLLLFFHVLFIYYINLRRLDIVTKEIMFRHKRNQTLISWLERTMDFFCVPLREKGYYKWFLYISAVGIILYFINIISLDFARNTGPFPTVVLAFAVLLAFGNLVTAFSVHYKMNFHFLLFLLAFVIGGLHETHNVQTRELKNNENKYAQREPLEKYLVSWMNERKVLADSSKDGYEIYFVMANGGASRSGYWTASVLGRIEDASLKRDTTVKDTTRFSDHVFCLSGTSGGGVGVATFFSLLRDKEQHTDAKYAASAKAFLKNDYFTYTFARMLGPDFFNYIIPFSSKMDRAAALEKSFEKSAREKNDSIYPVPFDDNFSNFPAIKNGRIYLPILCVNTTRMQDGNPGVVTNLYLDPAIFNNRVDVVKLLDKQSDISITSASILGARFPYLSPAGRIANNYFVDGGYFDNSGAGVVQEIIRGILNIAKRDSLVNGTKGVLYQQVRKLHFKVLHITNSPIILNSSTIKRVAPIKNDLLAPILTIVGAYDMQTTVNDRRLVNYINDINTLTNNKADYTKIPLYKDTTEWKQDELRKRFDTEPSYAMNWFMSDTTRNRIDKRLINHKGLNDLINGMKPQKQMLSVR